MQHTTHGARRTARRLALVAVLALVPAGRVDAIPYLRGDINQDGVASVADSHFLLSFLFRGNQPPGCMRTADVNADDSLNLTDSIFLLNYLVLGGLPPCRPFPEPGEGHQDEIDCREYAVEPPAEEPDSVFRVSNAIADATGRATFNVFVTNTVDLAGYFAIIRIEGARFGSVLSATDLSGTLAAGFAGARPFDGALRLGFLSTLVGVTTIEPGETQPAMQIQVCLEGDTPAGDYEVVVEQAELVVFETGRAILPSLVGDTLAVPEALGNTGCTSPDSPSSVPDCGPPDIPIGPPDGPTLDFARGDINLDGQVSIADSVLLGRLLFDGDDETVPACLDAADTNDDGGISMSDVVFLLNHLHLEGLPPPDPFLSTGPDPTLDRLGCAEDTTTPPLTTEDTIAIGEAEAVPGQVVRVPVLVSISEEVEAFQVLIDVDPDLFDTVPGNAVSFTGALLDGVPVRSSYLAVRRLRGDENVVVVAVVPSLRGTALPVAPGENLHVFSIVGRVSLEARPGTEIVIQPTNGPDGAGFGPVALKNELVSAGASRLPANLAAGRIRVVEGELQGILRGDSNHDGRVDIADSSHILNFLFLGNSRPVCLDESDADDDGTVNITDAVRILSFLFLGGPELPPPFPEPGLDLTSDEFECFF